MTNLTEVRVGFYYQDSTQFVRTVKENCPVEVSLSTLRRPPSTAYRQKGSENREVRNSIYADVTALHTVLCGVGVYMAFIFSSRGAY
jgi:hypothetical protein